MKDEDKSKDQLLDELLELRQEVKELNETAYKLNVFRTLYINAPIPYQSLNTDGCLLYANQAWLNTLGYSKDEVFGRWFGDFLDPGYVEKFKKNFPCFKDEGEICVDFKMLRKDGSNLLVSFEGKISYDENGNFKQTHCIFRDITDQNKVQEALQKSEDSLQLVLEGAELGTWDWDLQTDEVMFNERWAAMLGFTLGEIEPHISTWERSVHPEDLPKVREILNAHLKNKTELYEAEFRMRHKTGGWVWILDKGKVIGRDLDGKPLRACGTHLDITERKQKERNLDLERKQLISIFDGMDEVIYVADPKTYELIYLNEPAKKQWGNAVGKKCYKALQNLDSPCSFCSNHIIFNENLESSYVWEFQNKVNKRWYRCIDKAIQWPAKKIVRFEMAIDITELKKSEEQIRHFQKMESVGTLAGGIAHEFNNILGGILGYTEISRDDLSDDNPVQEYLNEIIKLGHRAREVVKQILSFSRKDKQKRKALQLHIPIENSLKVLKMTLPSTIQIKHDLDRNCGTIIADSTQFHQVGMNLCANAAQAMEEKGGILTISLSPVILDMEENKKYPGLNPGLYVKLTVSDTGAGISPDIIDNIFDPFFTTKGVGKGTGMGLSVVHGIINDHGGAITVESKVGKGTTFTILLPKVEGEPEVEKEENALPTGTENILIVDDEEFMVFSQKKILARLGYKVTAMTSSLETLKLFKKDPQRYDLIITDLTMPHLTGDRLAIEVTAIRPDMPVILATGYIDAVDSEKVEQIGIKAFIPKPYKKKDLAKTIRLILDDK